MALQESIEETSDGGRMSCPVHMLRLIRERVWKGPQGARVGTAHLHGAWAIYKGRRVSKLVGGALVHIKLS